MIIKTISLERNSSNLVLTKYFKSFMFWIELEIRNG